MKVKDYVAEKSRSEQEKRLHEFDQFEFSKAPEKTEKEREEDIQKIRAYWDKQQPKSSIFKRIINFFRKKKRYRPH